MARISKILKDEMLEISLENSFILNYEN